MARLPRGCQMFGLLVCAMHEGSESHDYACGFRDLRRVVSLRRAAMILPKVCAGHELASTVRARRRKSASGIRPAPGIRHLMPSDRRRVWTESASSTRPHPHPDMNRYCTASSGSGRRSVGAFRAVRIAVRHHIPSLAYKVFNPVASSIRQALRIVAIDPCIGQSRLPIAGLQQRRCAI